MMTGKRITNVLTVAIVAMGMMVGAANAAPWTPAEITTALWLDAADASTITESSGSVSRWDDKSGNDRDVSQLTSDAQPTTQASTLNSLNVLTFDGNDHMQYIGALATEPNTVFVVTRVRALGLGGTRNFVFDGAVSEPSRHLLALERDGKPHIYAYNWLSATSSTTTDDAVYECTFNGTTSSVIGVNAVRVTGDAFGVNNYTFNEGITIGSNYKGDGDHLDGNIAELIVYSGLLSEEDREKIEGYLAWKWGLEGSLPTGHPYEGGAPGSGGTPGTLIYGK